MTDTSQTPLQIEGTADDDRVLPRAALVKSSSGRYFIATEGIPPKDATCVVYDAESNIFNLCLEDDSQIAIIENADPEFCCNVADQKSIALVMAEDPASRVRLPLRIAGALPE